MSLNRREIPKLHALCLRAIGHHSCCAETTFGGKKKEKDGNGKRKVSAEDDAPKLTGASRLLRSFHYRPIDSADAAPALDDENDATDPIRKIPLHRSPCIGPGSARRAQPNEIDLNHPIIAYRHFGENMDADGTLVMQYGSPALDCLQSYLDSLVELGRMDDSRLGKCFFMEWRRNVLLADGKRDLPVPPSLLEPEKKRSKKKKSKKKKSTSVEIPAVSLEPPSLGSLSLYNCSIAGNTVAAMVESGMGENLAVLDLSGIHPLTDDLLGQLFPTCPNLLRLSIKNCRRLTRQTMVLIGSYTLKLQCLDVGGSYNIAPRDLLDTIPYLPDLVDLLASGLSWTDTMVSELNSRPWQALGLGFCPSVTEASIKTIITTPSISSSLERLSLPFCESLVDHALLGFLGRNAPNVVALDLRGNSSVSSLTGWYDGRASANLPGAPLYVLARFTSVTKGSVEDTKRIHPLEASQLVIVLDSQGVGLGLRGSRGEGAESVPFHAGHGDKSLVQAAA